MKLTTWWRNRRLNRLREKLAGREAALADLRRCGYGNASIAEDIGALKYRIALLEQKQSA